MARAAAHLNDAFQRIRANPQSEELIFGNSFRWWADALDRRYADDLLRSSLPILLVQGARDGHAPLAAAQRARDLFKQAGQAARLTYWEEEGLDHFMKDANGVSHEEDVMARIADWIRAH